METPARLDGRRAAVGARAGFMILAPMLKAYEPRALLTELNVVLMLPDRFLMTVISATTIKPVNTAYSTAVGPSSLTRNVRTLETNLAIIKTLSKDFGRLKRA
jgi:hypothetical protein